MNLDKLEKQILIWNKAAIGVPVVCTSIILALYIFQLCSLDALILTASGLYFLTAIVWWWWTMKSIHLLVYVLKNTNTGVEEVAGELKNIRKELQVDNKNNK